MVDSNTMLTKGKRPHCKTRTNFVFQNLSKNIEYINTKIYATDTCG